MNILIGIRSSTSLKPEELLSYYVGFQDGDHVQYTEQRRELTNGTTQIRTGDETEWRNV